MAKKVFWGKSGQSPTADAVMAWLDRVGIDKRMVTGFSTFHHVGEVPRITLEMYFDDAPQPADVTGLDKTERETVPTVSREITKPEPSLVTVLRADHRTGMHANQPNLHCPLCPIPTPNMVMSLAAAYANAHADGLHKGDGFSPNCSACQQDKKEG